MKSRPRAQRITLASPRPAVDSTVDWLFFVFGGASAIWLAYLLFRESFSLGWGEIWFSVVYWVLLAYLVLPRLHRILTRIYVPDYFIGRARTSDGLLGDPINVALLGSEAQVHEVMGRAGWTMADDLSLATGWRIVASTLLRRSYLEAPVSPLLLFGRKQDFAYQQEVDGTPGKRHHVRFWRCPDGWMLPGGQHADWLAAGTYDRSVGLSLFTLQITHKIDENTDAERDHIVDSARGAAEQAAVSTIRDFSTGYHSRNGGGDAIVTDGDLPIVDLRGVPSTPGRVDILTDSRDKRPAPTIVGAALVAARAVEGIVLIVTLLLGRGDVLVRVGANDTPADEAAITLVVSVFAGLLAVFVAVELLVAWRIFLGRNWARVLAMSLSAASIALQAVSLATGGPGITLQTTLPGLSLDVLLILALSSERALVYARRDRKAPKRISGRPGDVAAF
ncbi:LssY C-terminal domain-containing protein [Lacisediminihabitans sp.]|uniref:LssY C-terminal domain-containing protein n=1 Tax=Lacisediminihabitans sp. TaxID=2787631 RepID=UPI00374D0736